MSAEFVDIESLYGGNGDVVGKPLRLETLEDVIAHVNFHEGQISAFWEEQHRFNKRSDATTTTDQSYMQQELKEMRSDIKKLSNRIFFAMGGASMLGAVFAVVATLLLEAFGRTGG
jgi:hypothetical protein